MIYMFMTCSVEAMSAVYSNDLQRMLLNKLLTNTKIFKR